MKGEDAQRNFTFFIFLSQESPTMTWIFQSWSQEH